MFPSRQSPSPSGRVPRKGRGARGEVKFLRCLFMQTGTIHRTVRNINRSALTQSQLNIWKAAKIGIIFQLGLLSSYSLFSGQPIVPHLYHKCPEHHFSIRHCRRADWQISLEKQDMSPVQCRDYGFTRSRSTPHLVKHRPTSSSPNGHVQSKFGFVDAGRQ